MLLASLVAGLSGEIGLKQNFKTPGLTPTPNNSSHWEKR